MARLRRYRRAGLECEPLEDRALPSASSSDLLALPLSFEANSGQTDSQVQYLARGLGYGLFLTPGQAVLNLYDPRNQEDPGTILQAQFVGANLGASARGLDQQPGHANYYIGPDANHWQTEVALYSRVRYQGIYPGIDLVYYGTNQQQLEYDFVVAPGADPGIIRVAYQGADSMELDKQGNLVLHTASGDVIQQAPIVYQNIAGERRSVAGSFLLQGREVSFQLGSYDSTEPLVIDPVLMYSTYVGGSGLDEILDIDVRPYYQNQYLYVTGYTRSADFPLVGGAADRTLGGSSDAFAFRMTLDGVGTSLLYATYLGGSGRENDFTAGGGKAAVAVGNAYNTFVTGMTQSADFPVTAGALQTTLKGTQDAFVAQLTTAGALVYATYLGGTGNEAGTGIDVDSLNYPADFAIVSGWTTSANFPVQGAIQSTLGGGVDAFVAKISPNGSSLLYATYLGGSGNDAALDIALDPTNDDAFVTGRTSSSDFPTTFGMDRTLGGASDAFVAKINLAGTALLFSTYLGGRNDENLDAAHGTDVGALAVDSLGSVYITGSTASDNFPLFGPFDSVLGASGSGWDAFLTKLDSSGSTIYSTYLGGASNDFGLGIAVNGDGLAMLTGYTESADFPLQNPGQAARAGSRDAFVTAFDAQGTGLVFSTYLGGAGGSEGTIGRGIAVDKRNQVYVVGGTDSAAFPTVAAYAPNTAPYQSSTRGGGDGFLAKFAFLPGVVEYDLYNYSGVPVTEGGPTTTYQLKLQSAPTANVIITFNPDAQVTVSVPAVTFTPSSWNSWQVVTVTAVDDSTPELTPHRGIISHTATSSDFAYNGIAIADMTADVEDNDTVGVLYNGSSLSTLAEGTTNYGSYSIQLTSRPTADVVITAVPDGQVLLSPDGVTYASAPVVVTLTAANWYVPQRVYVTAFDDTLSESPAHSGLITNTAVSGDLNYNGISLRTFTATIADNDTPGFVFAQVGTNSVNVTEAGNDDFFTVVLKTQPAANVIVTQTPDAQETVAPSRLTFTAANWDVPQTVTVNAVDDLVVERLYPSPHNGSISFAASSSDVNYNNFSIPNMPVSVRDNDTIDVYLGGTGTTLSEGGLSDDYTIVLTSTPTANVVISLDPGTQLAVAPVLLTFTPANWYVIQAVNVTAIQDGLVESSPHSGIIAHTVTSADAGYHGRAVASITANITDDDVADMILLESSTSTDVSEIGPTSDRYTIRLGSQPFFDVFITVNAGGQFSLSAPVLTFNGTNWNTPQTETVTALDDFIDEAALHTGILSHVVTSADLLYNGWALASVTANIVDNDTAGVTLTTTGSTNVSEGGATDTYAIVLNSQPTANVLITLRPDAQVGVSPAGVLTFNAANWNVPQTVTVSGIHDFLVESPLHQGVIRHTETSSDPFYSGLAVVSVTASITEIDVGGVAVTESGGTTQVAEAGGTDSFTVVLTSTPTANVVITLTSSTQVSLSTQRLTFTPANWTVEQTVTVAAVDDLVAEGAHSALISLTPASADLLYNNFVIRSLTTNILDDDVVEVIQSSGTTVVAEGGLTDTYTLRLSSMPTANVVISLQPDSEITVNPAAVTFTPGNWNVTQAVTVGAVDDLVAEIPNTGIIRHTSVSADPFYDGVAIHDVVAQITDNDTPAVAILPSGGTTVVTEGVAGDLYDVVLLTQPTANVTVLVTADPALVAAPSSLVFTPGNWNVPQTVSVTAPDNGIIDGIRTGAITHVALSTDPFYQGLAVNSLTVSIHDPSGYTLTSTNGQFATLEGTSLSYSMILNTAPRADVYVDLAGDGQAGVSPARLVFTAADWNVPHPIIVTARDDSAVEGPQSALVGLTFSSADAAYESLGQTDFAVGVVDNDGEPVLGTAGADQIVVSSSADRSHVLVSVNNKVISYPAGLAQLAIQAGDGNDNIYLQDPALPITVLGGRGLDKVFVTGESGANTFVLGSSSVTVNGVGVLVWDVENLILNGRAGSDALFVENVPAFATEFKGDLGNDLVVAGSRPNTWQITTANGGFLDHAIKLNGVENWTGGASADTFVFSAGKTLSGSINGGGGLDVLDYSACTAAVTVNLQTQTATGARGIQNIARILGGKSTADKVIGPNQINLWNITATNAGTVNGIAFQNVENLTGGSQADVFRLANGTGIKGKIDGAGGSDTLDYAAYRAQPVTINLQAKSATNLGGFLNLEAFQAGASLADSLIGFNRNSLWTLTAIGSGSLDALSFAGFENLTGGTLADTFNLSPGAGWLGTLSGGSGKDTLRAAPGQANAWTNTTLGSGTLNGRKFTGIEVRL